MKLASNFAYLKRKLISTQNQLFAPEVDTNVIGIGFDILKDAKDKIHQGDPISCENCKSVLNKYSKVLSSSEYLNIVQLQKVEQKEEKEEKKNQEKLDHSIFVLMAQKDNQIQELQENESIWVCEFCSYINQLMIEREEIPKTEDVVYLVQSAQQVQMEKQNLQAEQTVILCIDNSGSMSSTTEVKGKINLKHGLSVEEYEMLKQFIEPGDENQFYPGLMKQNVTYVSRKQCVLAAIEQEVSDMQKDKPNRVVGLVTFNNEVVLFGDGSQDPVVITGDRLYKGEDITKIASENAQKLLSRTVKDASNTLIEKFSKLQEKGQTALGPALLASIELAKQGKPGSIIILCTDGLANLGLGALEGLNDDNDQASHFYAEIAQIAKSNGITISVVTIKGEGCRMDVLGQLSEQTNGNVTRVNPNDLGKNFANILKDEVVGTQVVLVVKIHQALKFRNEDQGVSQDGLTLQRDIGNATVNTQCTFEYELKADDELQLAGVDVNNLKQVPFQARIEYVALNGDKILRVLTQMVNTTEDLVKAERDVKVDVIHTRVTQETAKHVRRGSFNRAQEYNNRWDDYVQNNSAMNEKIEIKAQNLEFKANNLKLNKVAAKKEQQSKKLSVPSQKSDQKEGFFAKIFKGNAKKQPELKSQKQKRLEEMNVEEDNDGSYSDQSDDSADANVLQFMQAKKK